MLIHRRDKSNVKTISYTVFDMFGITVKFKLKLYNTDKNKIEKSIMQEYVFDKNTAIVINGHGNIDVVLKTQDSSSYFYLTEVYRSRLLRKLQKVINALELYDSKEIDLLSVTGNGTKLRSEISQSVSCDLGSQIVIFTPYYDERFSSVNVAITYDNTTVTLPASAFLLLIQKLKDINYDSMTMQLINYYNSYDVGEISQPNLISGIDDVQEVPKQTLTTPYTSDIMSIAEDEKPEPIRLSNRLTW